MRPSFVPAATASCLLLISTSCTPNGSGTDSRITPALRASCSPASDAQITATLETMQGFRDRGSSRANVVRDTSDACQDLGTCATEPACLTAAADIIYAQ